VLSAFDYLDAGDLLPPGLNDLRIRLWDFCEKEKIGKVAEYFEKNEFPEFWLSKFKEFGLGEYLIEAPYGK
jgi:hypothetical protein